MRKRRRFLGVLRTDEGGKSAAHREDNSIVEEDAHWDPPVDLNHTTVHGSFFCNRLCVSGKRKGLPCRNLVSPGFTACNSHLNRQERQELDFVNQSKGKTFCLCKSAYVPFAFMIACDGCDDWFHGQCVGVSKIQSILLDTYLCPTCDPKSHAGETASEDMHDTDLQQTENREEDQVSVYVSEEIIASRQPRGQHRADAAPPQLNNLDTLVPYHPSVSRPTPQQQCDLWQPAFRPSPRAYTEAPPSILNSATEESQSPRQEPLCTAFRSLDHLSSFSQSWPTPWNL